MSEWGFETRQIHAGTAPDPATGARAIPIYQTTSYVFRDTAHAAALFGLAELGNIYTRIMNPTQDAFEQRIASLEGGVAALAVASGQAAETISLLNLAENGGHIVSSASLYGGTYNLFHYTLPKLGVETTFVNDPDDLAEWAAAIRPNTKAFFGETLGNPKGDVFNFEGVSKGRSRTRDSPRHRQHSGHSVSVPAAGARCGHRRALGDQVHRRTRHLDRRRHR
jgi:O-acetylhomoserine (thiol)-lyase